jgi:hypothetical protein
VAGLLFVERTQKGRRWIVLKAQMGWMMVAVTSQLIALDIINRMFTEPAQGVGSHLIYFVQLLRYARDVVPHYTINSDPWLYLKDFAISYGMVLPILGFTGLILSKKILPEDRQKRLLALVFLVGSLAFVAQTQKFANKEERYLLPFLPFILSLLALGIVGAVSHFSKKWQPVWIGLCALALVIPIRDSFRRTSEQKLAMATWQNVPNRHLQLWYSLMKPSAAGTTCNRVYTCETFRTGLSFAWGPVFYHLGYKPSAANCEGEVGRDYFRAPTDVGSCYVLPTGHGVLSERFAGGHLDATAVAQLREKITSDETLDCTAAKTGTSKCYIVRSFADL